MQNPLTLDPIDPQYPDTPVKELPTCYQDSYRAHLVWKDISFKDRAQLLL